MGSKQALSHILTSEDWFDQHASLFLSLMLLINVNPFIWVSTKAQVDLMSPINKVNHFYVHV
jgi:hypothetical protein